MAKTKGKEKNRAGARVTQDEQLLESPRLDEFTHTDTWRVFRIMGEFVEGFDDLAHVDRGVAIFGSARTPPDHPQYDAARETAALLARAGFAVITGGGPGIMEAANRGAFEAGGISVGYNSAGDGQPTWLGVSLDVLAYAGAALGITAAANVGNPGPPPPPIGEE